MECPSCGLTNPPEAMRCDCGFNFVKNTINEPLPANILPDRHRQPAIRGTMRRKFIGSTIALVIGILSFIGSIAQISKGHIAQINPLAGVVIILGSLAYISLKRRRLGLVESTNFKQIFEIIALVLIVSLVVLQKDLKTQLAYRPVPNFVIPLWSLIAYSIIFFKKPIQSSR